MRLIHRTAVVASALSLSLAALPIAASAQQETPKPLEPDGPWRLGKAGDGCSVTRDFGTGEDRVTFSMQRVHPGAEIQFGLFGAHIEREGPRIESGFVPSAALGGSDLIADAAISGVPGLVYSGYEFPELISESAQQEDRIALGNRYKSLVDNAQAFHVKGASEQPLSLRTGSPAQAIKALEHCMTEKLAALGITEELAQKTVKRPKAVNVEQWAAKVQQRYPVEALRYSRDGMVQMRLVIGPNGRVEDCAVLTHLTAKSLRDAACGSMLEFAEYEPARDVQGNPLRGLIMQNVRYEFAQPFKTDAHGLKVKD